ncbi:hypothetical protein HUG10_21020 (plasmid) [Halorarum halophilum]|uniref:Uncharacterized protein n=1 Tax=Halorarum halophilum TaxID=2743090 RepID=A0A7D5GIP9_9EURY|nr:hypothetical protein [Halobaculum halophilum]QLG30070.1 hypothetical protein HUG10_21020 [Halobaculum halophilum]
MRNSHRALLDSNDEIIFAAAAMTGGAFLLLWIVVGGVTGVLFSGVVGLFLGLAIALLASPILYFRFMIMIAAYVEWEIERHG